jgi:hypothetical protein
VSDAAIGYFTEQKTRLDDIARLLARGDLQLPFEDSWGYLPSLLTVLDVHASSRVSVYSKTSVQARTIGRSNPRQICFNDTGAIAWVRGGFIELAELSPEQGVVFYTMSQDPSQHPQLHKRSDCLGCHLSATELSDYLLFIDEAPLPVGLRGHSTFAKEFEAGGPRDRRGRTVRVTSGCL